MTANSYTTTTATAHADVGECKEITMRCKNRRYGYRKRKWKFQ